MTHLQCKIHKTNSYNNNNNNNNTVYSPLVANIQFVHINMY